MLGLLVVLGLLVTGGVYTFFYPILIPAPIIDGFVALLTPVYAFDGVLPVHIFFEDLTIFIYLLIALLIFRLGSWLVGLLTGGGQADV
jgi:hypothetical protein